MPEEGESEEEVNIDELLAELDETKSEEMEEAKKEEVEEVKKEEEMEEAKKMKADLDEAYAAIETLPKPSRNQLVKR